MPRPVIGVPYNPEYTNPAFHQTIGTLQQDFEFNILQLDCRYFNNEHLTSLIQANMAFIDGVFIPGSAYDIDPKFYNENVKTDILQIADDERHYKYQAAMVKRALSLGMPVLGICAGSYVINIAQGGTLEQSIINSKDNNINHDIDPRTGALAHEVTVKAGTHLHDIISGKADNEAKNKDITMQVNSWHHSVNKKLAETLIESAAAPNKITEAVEMKYPGNSNCWGIQFHPEYVSIKKDPDEYHRQTRILLAFRKASLQFQFKRHASSEIKLIESAASFFSKKKATQSGSTTEMLSPFSSPKNKLIK